jgi:two-component system response regulator YesN
MHRSNSVFKAQLVSYIVLMLLPVTIIALLYAQIVQSTTQLCMDACESALFDVRDEFDGYLADFDKTAVNISMMSDFKKIAAFRTTTQAHEGIYDIWQFSQKLRSSAYVPETLEYDYQILFQRGEIVFWYNSAVCGLEMFFDTAVSYPQMTFAQWHEACFSSAQRRFLPMQQVILRSADTQALTYLFPVVVNAYEKQVSAVFSFQIQKRTLDQIFLPALTDRQGCAYLLDTQGNLLYASDAQAQAPVLPSAALWSQDGSWNDAQSKTLYAYARSNYGDLIYLVSLPHNTVLAQLYTVSRTIWIVICAYLLASVALALVFAWRRSKPMRDLAARLSGGLRQAPQTVQANEYEFIAQNMLKLIADNESLKRADSHKAAALAGIALEHLLCATARPGDQGIEMLAGQGFPVGAYRWAVAVLRAYMPAQLDSADAFPIFELLALAKEAASAPCCYLHAMDSQTVVLIYAFDAQSDHWRSQVRQSLLQIDGCIAAKRRIHPYFGCGGCFEDLYDLHFSYDQALEAVLNLQDAKQAPYLAFYDEFAGEAPPYYYPIELEYRLINCVKAGQTREVGALLEQLAVENFSSRRLSPSMTRMLCQDLSGTLLKLSGAQDAVSFTALDRAQTPSERFMLLRKALLNLASSAEQRKRSHNDVLKERILAFLEENYADAQLCVAMIAQQFNLSESYFSEFFKMQTGENFSAYLENLRITHARTLFEQMPAIEVEAVARQVGYGNTNTFRRAFKRVTGFSPSAYREYAVKNTPGM